MHGSMYWIDLTLRVSISAQHYHKQLHCPAANFGPHLLSIHLVQQLNARAQD